MNELTNTHHKEINPEHKEAIKAALLSWYSGKYSTLTDALYAAEGIGKTTYYAYKKHLPDEVDKLDREAKRLALLERSGKQIAFEAEVLDDSIELQRMAINALREAIPQLASIAAGEVREVEMLDRDGEPYTKTIAPYPRDIIGATAQLQQLARGGVLPEQIVTNFEPAQNYGMAALASASANSLYVTPACPLTFRYST